MVASLDFITTTLIAGHLDYLIHYLIGIFAGGIVTGVVQANLFRSD
jgi:hypothetical protein